MFVKYASCYGLSSGFIYNQFNYAKKRTEDGGDISELSQVSPEHMASILNVCCVMLNTVCGKLEYRTPLIITPVSTQAISCSAYKERVRLMPVCATSGFTTGYSESASYWKTSSGIAQYGTFLTYLFSVFYLSALRT